MSTTQSVTTTITFDSDDPGDCMECLTPVIELNDDCDCSHGDIAAEYALADYFDVFSSIVQEHLDSLRNDNTRAWAFTATNVGWTHSSSEGLIHEDFLEVEEMVNMLVHNRRIDSHRITAYMSDPTCLVVHLLHHDAMFNPEEFTFTPVNISE